MSKTITRAFTWPGNHERIDTVHRGQLFSAAVVFFLIATLYLRSPPSNYQTHPNYQAQQGHPNGSHGCSVTLGDPSGPAKGKPGETVRHKSETDPGQAQ